MKNSYHVDKTTKVKHDPKSKLSKLRAIEQEKREEHQNREEILEMGQDNKRKGDKAVSQIEGEVFKKDVKAQQNAVDELDRKKRYADSYKGVLAKALAGFLELMDWPDGWEANVIITDGSPITLYGKGFMTQNGILVAVRTARGYVYHKGMLISGDQVLDYSGVHTLAVQVENTLDDARGSLVSSKAKQPLPNIVDKHGRAI